jgi:adenylate cyclase
MTATRRLAAILAADVAGYSRLMGEDEVGTAQALSEHRAAADPLVARHGGRIVKTTGDGMLIEFSSVVAAVECSLVLQKLAAERNAEVAPERRMEWRIGIHIGDVLVEGDDILGDGVNIAARLEGIAEPGGIYISEDAFRQVRGKVGTEFADIGEQSLKNIARPVRVYRVPPTKREAVDVTRPALPLPDKPSIAVLPFANISGDPEQEYFADGMVEEIITALSRIRWLFVIARNSSFTYKGRAVDVKQMARELGVRYVLEGNVRKAGNRVRITGQLIDTSSGAHIWADRFDSTLEDIFELQDQVASSVAGAIEPTLRKAEFDRVARKPTESLDAYDLYLRALALRDTHTDESVREAIALLKRALAIDPGYAPAAASIGWQHIHQLSHGRNPVSEADAAEAVAFAGQALEVGKDDPDTLWMAAASLETFAGEHGVAAAAVDRALTLNPNCALAWTVRGVVLGNIDQPGAAIEAFERAMRLSPLDRHRRNFTNGIAHAHLTAGRYEEAIDWAERTLREEPGYRGAIVAKVVGCAHLDRIEEARAAVGQLVQSLSGYTITQYKARWSRAFSSDKMAIYVEGLRKAGVPEE